MFYAERTECAKAVDRIEHSAFKEVKDQLYWFCVVVKRKGHSLETKWQVKPGLFRTNRYIGD